MEKNQMSDGFIKSVIVLSISFFMFNVFNAGCVSKEVNKDKKIESPVIEQPKTTIIPLSWEKNHPERFEWSKSLFKKIEEKFLGLNKAKDLPTFCSKYETLPNDKKKIVLAELWVWTAYYESGWNPKSASVDVGSKLNKDTWSAGLWQMSVVDQTNWGLKFGYKYDDLLQVEPNLNLSLSILEKQIDKKGNIALPSGMYWAVLSSKPGYKYTKLKEIRGKIQSIEFCK